MSHSHLLGAFGVALLALPAAAGNVLRVGPARAYPTVQAALAAAVAGDVILVDPGSYPAFVNDGKAVAVAADAAPFTVVQQPGAAAIEVRNIAAGSSASVTGARIAYSEPSAAAVLVHRCGGAVRIRDVEVGLGADVLLAAPRAAVEIAGVATCLWDNSPVWGRARGSTGNPATSPYGPDHGLAAMLVADSVVVLHNPRLQGFDNPGLTGNPSWAGDGLRVTGSSRVWIHNDFYGAPRGEVAGGAGGDYGGSAVQWLGPPPRPITSCGPANYTPGAGSVRRGGYYSIDYDGGSFQQGNIRFDRVVPLCLDLVVGMTVTAAPTVSIGGRLGFEVWNLYGRAYATFLAASTRFVPAAVVPGAAGNLLFDPAGPYLVAAAGALAPRVAQGHGLTVPAVRALQGLQLTLQTAMAAPAGQGGPPLVLTPAATAVIVP